MKTQTQRQFIKKIENILFFIFKKRNWQYLFSYFYNVQSINDFLKKHQNKRIFITHSMPFDVPLYQRPQHLAVQLSQTGSAFVYAELKNSKSRLINENLLLADFNLVNKVCIKNNIQPYLFVVSVSPHKLKDLIKLKNAGYRIIYEYIDEFSEEIHNTKNGLEIFNNLEKLEPVLCIATSRKLYNHLLTKFPKEKLLLNPNAANIEDFDKNVESLPEDISEIKRMNKPIVGYYGAIATWLNYDLINKLTLQRPDYNFVFIGSDFKGLSLIQKRKNVFYLGEKRYKDLYMYSKQFSCAIIPFKEGEIATATSPVKLFEYMAVGKQVVCTKDLLECAGYDGVYLAQNDEDFLSLVDRAIQLSGDEALNQKLIRSAYQNTWQQRANDIYNALIQQKD